MSFLISNQFIVDNLPSYYKMADTFYCDICDMTINKKNKYSHIRSKYHEYQINGKKCIDCGIEIDKKTSSQIRKCISCYKKSKEIEMRNRFINYYNQDA